MQESTTETETPFLPSSWPDSRVKCSADKLMLTWSDSVPVIPAVYKAMVVVYGAVLYCRFFEGSASRGLANMAAKGDLIMRREHRAKHMLSYLCALAPGSVREEPESIPPTASAREDIADIVVVSWHGEVSDLLMSYFPTTLGRGGADLIDNDLAGHCGWGAHRPP